MLNKANKNTKGPEGLLCFCSYNSLILVSTIDTLQLLCSSVTNIKALQAWAFMLHVRRGVVCHSKLFVLNGTAGYFLSLIVVDSIYDFE